MEKQNPDSKWSELEQSVHKALLELNKEKLERNNKYLRTIIEQVPAVDNKTITEAYDAALRKVLSIDNIKDAVSYSESISIKTKLKKVKSVINAKPEPADGKLYYYTDFDTFVNKIVEVNGNKSKKLSLLAGHCEYMNDKDEFKSGYDLLCDNDNIQESTKDTINRQKESTPFIIAFSLAKDSLPMWNMYGNRAGGVMLGFDFDYLDRTYKNNIKSCIYKDSDAYKILLDFLFNKKSTMKQILHQEVSLFLTRL